MFLYPNICVLFKHQISNHEKLEKKKKNLIRFSKDRKETKKNAKKLGMESQAIRTK